MTGPSDTLRTSKRNALVFLGVASIWLLFDMLTKRWADTVGVGSVLDPGIPGFIDFRLVHNTGAAWGAFGGSTVPLGVFAIVFCAALLVFAYLRRDKAGVFEMVGYGLVLAGGIGNAIDRFANGYVVDFIETLFIDFPVFNIADIGVTCGFVIVILSYLMWERRERDKATEGGA